jgi:UDP:flavonoid glycosyltransferase YjiC (YdhE family)
MKAVKRILFFAEAVTLAHVARPLALATTLDHSRFEPVLACDPRYLRFCAGPWQLLGLDSISSRMFATALANGAPLYDTDTLRRYVKQDLEIIDRIKPDVIVGDFRLSLSVSARLVGIPYVGISNAYWSPNYSAKYSFPLPVLPITRWLPLPLAATLFRLGRSAAFRLHCRPLNRVRGENGLPSLGVDLRRVYTDADFTAYADMPELFPIGNLPPGHGYLGPVLWSPLVPKPTWWDHLPNGRPVVYVTLGSSGDAGLLATVLKGLEGLPVTVIASTAGAAMPDRVPANSYVADYLPGSEAAARSALVICNGGSLTCQQAVAAGVPVVGIASNMDQFLNMGALVRAGAGCLLRADRVDAAHLGNMVSTAIATDSLSRSASRLASHCTTDALGPRFARILDIVLGERPSVLMSEPLNTSRP